jgi:hypothetical protein
MFFSIGGRGRGWGWDIRLAMEDWVERRFGRK